MKAEKYSFGIVDDHSIVRWGLKLLLQNHYSDCSILEAQDGKEAVELLKKHQLDLLILDVQMPDAEPLTLIDYIIRMYPSIKILVFSMFPENIFGKRFLNLGAKGYLNKTAEKDKIIGAIESILSGKIYVSQSLKDSLINSALDGKPTNPLDQLSNREMEVLILLIKGGSIKEISKVLNLQNSTIGTYKARIFEKLEIKNNVDLIEIASIYNLNIV